MTTGRHALPSPLGKIYSEIAKFGLVGLSGIAVNILVFNLVRYTTDMQPVRASVVATAVAILSNYIGFRYFTYKDRAGSSRRRELVLFALFSAIGLLIENGVLFAATYGLGLEGALLNNFFKFVGIGVATLFRFWSYRTWVFKAAPEIAPTAPVPVGALHGFTDVAHGVFEEVETMALRTIPHARPAGTPSGPRPAAPSGPRPAAALPGPRTAGPPAPRPAGLPGPRTAGVPDPRSAALPLAAQRGAR